jgi:arsenate reductase-like glutaredoxin family protein
MLETAAEVVDARKRPFGRAEALKLAKTADVVIAARGKNAVTFDMKNAPPDDDTLAEHILGPTGNLKAPAIRRGKMLIVGFGQEAYRQVFGQ